MFKKVMQIIAMIVRIAKMYGCEKHKMTFEEFWDEVNHLVEGEGFCPKCVLNDLYGEVKNLSTSPNKREHNSRTIQSAITPKELIKRRDELKKHPERGIKLKDL